MAKAASGLIILLLATGLSAGCGQKGPLERPVDASLVVSGSDEPGTNNR